ncbi:MAG: DoxX family protein [Xanthobacteraceae bacterium]
MARHDLGNGAELAGRMLLGLLFVLEASSKLGDYAGALRYMAAFGMPPVLLPGAIALELGAGAMIIIGWRTRWGAAALAGFCALAAVVFHANFSNRSQVVQLEKDLALAGAFLVLWARGAGAWSLDSVLAGRRMVPDVILGRSQLKS